MRETLIEMHALVHFEVSNATHHGRSDSNNASGADNPQERLSCGNSHKMMRDYKTTNQNHGHYIAGFVDGEGIFNVSLKKRKDYKGQWKITASFNVSQKDRVILSFIKKVIGCGTLRTRHDGIVYYEVTNIHSLYENILPFFKRFRFLSANKKRNFALFSKIVEKMHKKEHLTGEGFKEILQLREKLNEGIGRTRTYTLQDVQDAR